MLGPITTPDQELQRRKEIIDLGSTPVGDILPKTDVGGKVWPGPVSVQDIWSVLASVEEVDAPIKVPGGIQPCD